jgi:hypothetical protein
MHNSSKIFGAQQPAQTNKLTAHVDPLPKSQIEFFVPYFPLVLTMIGWAVVSSQHNKRERRKEIRDLIRLLEQRVDNILEHASEYYSLDGTDKKCPLLRSKIVSNFTALSQLLARLRSAGLLLGADVEFISFKQAVTGGQFESQARKKIDASSITTLESATVGFAFVSKIENAYFKSFPVKMIRSWLFWSL